MMSGFVLLISRYWIPIRGQNKILRGNFVKENVCCLEIYLPAFTCLSKLIKPDKLQSLSLFATAVYGFVFSWTQAYYDKELRPFYKCLYTPINITVYTRWTSLTASSYYMNHCWLTIKELLWHSPEGNFAGDTQNIIPWYSLEYQWFDIIDVSFRDHWVKTSYNITSYSDKIWTNLHIYIDAWIFGKT